MILTNASKVVYAMPLLFAPVTRIVLPRIWSANALATSRPSVSWPNSGCVVEGMIYRSKEVKLLDLCILILNCNCVRSGFPY